MSGISEEVRQRIVALGDKGWSGSRIARRLGLKNSLGAVNYHLLRAGIDPFPAGKTLPPHFRKGNPFTPEEDARMLALARGGMAPHIVAKTIGRPRTSVGMRIMLLEIRAEKVLERAA